nr:Cna B-type domain-containing protein [Clostridia bacterium]
YKVKEENDGKAGVSYDETEYTITVTVTDGGEGKLIVASEDAYTALNFVNSYQAKANLVLNAFKTVNGYTPTVDQVYDFVLLGDGVEMKAQNKDENITFGTLAFDQDDVGKTFVYTVKETTEANELLDVDTTLYQVAVTVSDNGDGNLKLETEILKDGKRASGVVFDNTATATLSISKAVKGPGPDKAFDLKVTFIGVDGEELEGTYNYSGDVNGTITSGGVIALKDGQSVTIVGLPEGATYTVEENAGPAYTVTVNGKPVSKAEGTLVGHGKLEFINTVEVTTFSVTKIWEGPDQGEIRLTLYADGKQMTPQPEVTREGDRYTYYELPKYNEEGEEIVYSAKEQGIEGYIRIYKNVEPYADVTKYVHDGGTIINREEKKASFKIHKLWSGLEENEEIPEITLILYCNGEVVDVPTPKPDSKGWYEYYNLPANVNGVPAVYTVVEEAIPGFTVTYKAANSEIVEEGVNGGEIINTKVPQTGDNASLGLWLALMGASAALLTMLQRRRKA